MLVTFSDQFAVSGANFIIGIIAVRLLGAAEFGQYALILMLVTLASAYQESLLSIPMMTVVGKAAKRSENYFSAMTSWGIIIAVFYGSIVSTAISLIFMLRGDTLPLHIFVLTFLAVIGMNINQNIRRIFYVRQRADLALLLDILRFGMFFIGLVIFYILIDHSGTGNTQDLPWYRIEKAQGWHLLLLTTLVAFLSLIPFLPSMLKGRITKRLMVQSIKRHWPIGSWYILMTFVSMGQDTFIWIIMAIVLGDGAVGSLRLGQHLLGITHFILMGMENFVPKFAANEYRTGGVIALKNFLIKQNWIFGFITGGLILFIVLPAEFWLHHLYGSEFTQYADILRLYALSYVFIFMRELWNVYLRTIEKTRSSFQAYAWSSAVAMMIVYPAIKLYGVPGGAAVFTIASFISMAYTLKEVVYYYRLETDTLTASSSAANIKVL